MARVVDRWPSAPTRQYDWESWFDGRIHILSSGDDFECEPERFRAQVYENAARRGVVARTRVLNGEVVVQAIGRREKPFRCLTVTEQQRVATRVTGKKAG